MCIIAHSTNGKPVSKQTNNLKCSGRTVEAPLIYVTAG